MLTTVHAARGLAIRISSIWPSCRFPIVGTKTLFGSRCRRSRSAATEWIKSISKRMLRSRKSLRLHFLHVELDRTLDRSRDAHVVLDELRFLARVDVEHIV